MDSPSVAGKDGWLPTMEADPAGVLPGATDSGKRQLKGRRCWMKPQPIGRQAVRQDSADAEPQGVAAREHHDGLVSGKPLEGGDQTTGVIADEQGSPLVLVKPARQ